MKNIKTIIIILALNVLMMGGCKEDFTLDLTPPSSLTDASFWKTEGHWESFMSAVHSMIRADNRNFLRLGEFRADIFGEQSWTGHTVTELPVYLNTINEETPGTTGFAGFYNTINQLNLVIDKTLDTDILPEADRNFYLGQAYGMRAFYYFHLLRSWGGVVIQKEPAYGFEVDKLAKAASTASEVMEFIKEDIQNSETYFGNDYSFRTKVRWSKAATLMLKANVYLWSSHQMGGGTADAGIAKGALQQIQSQVPSLHLLPNYRDVFRYDNKQNDEIIYALKGQIAEYTFDFWPFVPRYANFGESDRDSLTGQPYTLTTHNIIAQIGGFNYAVFSNIYYGFLEGDTRKYESLQGAYKYIDGEYVLQPGLWQNKFQGSFDSGIRVFNDDLPMYRYADLLLMLAEAKSLLGEDPSNEINLVRERAFGANYNPSVQGYPNQDIDTDVNEALLKERLCEFLIEGKRWYDLRRFGVEYVTKYTSASPERLLWPIDKETLTNNPALDQAPGY